MEKVMVVGAGFMGSGIAQVCAQTGYSVYLLDVSAEALDTAMSGIKWSVEKFASKGMLKESPATILERIKVVNELERAADAAWVIEAAFICLGYVAAIGRAGSGGGDVLVDGVADREDTLRARCSQECVCLERHHEGHSSCPVRV